MQGDASSKVDLEHIVAQITQEIGYINLLVANAGIPGPTPIPTAGPSRSLADMQRDLWNTDTGIFNDTFSTNVGSVYYGLAAFLPLLDAGNKQGNVSQSSQVVITSSIGAYGRSPMAHFAYSASKAGITHMAKQFATAFTRYQIRFNVIAPGCKHSLFLHSDTL